MFIVDFDSARYYADPSGTFALYKAKAMGSGGEGAQSNLQEAYAESMGLEEAEQLALATLKQAAGHAELNH